MISIILSFITSWCLFTCDSAPEPLKHSLSDKAFIKELAKHKGHYKVGSTYKIKGKKYYPRIAPSYNEVGHASWYGPGFHNKKTANAEVYNQNDMTAAHKTLPLPSVVRVTNLENGRSIVVRVNDRGPYVDGRIIDLSHAGAKAIGMLKRGTAKVRVTLLQEPSLHAVAIKSGINKNKYSNNTGLDLRPTFNKTSLNQTPPNRAIYKVNKNIAATAKAPTTKTKYVSRSVEKVNKTTNFNFKPKTHKAKEAKFVYVPRPQKQFDKPIITKPKMAYKTVASRPTGQAGHYVNIGSFNDERNAKLVFNDVRKFANAKVKKHNNNYNVVLGPLVDYKSAKSVAEQINNIGYLDTQLYELANN